ncbi:MAG: hypothetical protein GX638_10350 [Crenarchaeota archaeon]|nr:hypothetical protein [Thermoproteota archaeon]
MSKKVLFAIFLIIIAFSLTATLIYHVLSPVGIKAINPHYLVDPSGDETKIFLESTTLSYGTYPFQDAQGLPGKPNIHTGDPCVIVEVTLRNDYTTQNPLPQHQVSIEDAACMFLTAALYDANGTKIQSTNVTPPYPPPSQFEAPLTIIPYEEKHTFNMYLTTNNQNINHFNIEILYLSSVPPP